MKDTQETIRNADEEIYLKENRYDNPKEISKQLLKCVPSQILELENPRFCDVGCAAGEFLYFLKKENNGKGEYVGVDVVPSLLEKAAGMVEGGSFHEMNVDDPKQSLPGKFNLITMTGVMSIFEEPNPSLNTCLKAMADRSCLVIGGLFNENPIDVVLRYKRANKDDAPWETGWNTFSKATMEKHVREYDSSLAMQWVDFKLPFAIDKDSVDPMRSWTVSHEGNPNFMVNGANILVDFKFLIIKKGLNH